MSEDASPIEFAKRCGFSIRRHRTEGKDGVGKGLTRRYFVCHRAGNTPVKTSTESKPQRNRKSSRCGCQAYMRISKTMELGTPEWRVTGFANHHNHELLEPNQVRFLPAYRTISDSDKSRILMYAKTGISVHQMMRLLELEKCVEPGYLPFTEKDSYDIFGDAVVFDTTHRLTAFDMPLGIWVGMNNYGMPCFFGCVLLREENLRSYSWALKAFLGFMNGKAPQTILTDQNMCLKEALSIEMPATKHALCIWMIVAKFPSWFSAVLGERYNEWKAEFYRLYNLESIEDFELGWRDMRFLSAQTRLAHFVEQVAVAVDFKDQTGEQQTMQQNLQNICLKTGAPMESHAATILTPFAFSKLQEQLVLAAHYASFPLEDGFLVRHHTKAEGGRRVYWGPREGIISCSCLQFEFSGILCRHALRVLSTGNCFQIPDRYLPSRWRRISMTSAKLPQSAPKDHAERVQLLQNMVSALITESSKSKERLDIATEQVSLLLSRIREQPVSLQGVRDVPGNGRNL
ncbi:hypothetical protein K1719_045843 [Acacia pycnantha]|nr:hypothetical protein K1719_045843 [Acacia pycnantha]